MGRRMVLTPAQRADRERRRARRNRSAAVVIFVLAALFVLLGLFVVLALGKPTGLITVAAAGVMVTSGMSLRLTADMQDENAKLFDRLAKGVF